MQFKIGQQVKVIKLCLDNGKEYTPHLYKTAWNKKYLNQIGIIYTIDNMGFYDIYIKFPNLDTDVFNQKELRLTNSSSIFYLPF